MANEKEGFSPNGLSNITPVKGVLTELHKLIGVTLGNLDHHVRKLAGAGYVKMSHVLDWRVIEITSLGAEFRDYTP